MDILEDNHEISSSYYSGNSEVRNVSIGCDFQNLKTYQFEPEKQDQADSFQYGHSPDKVGKKPTRVCTELCWKNWMVSIWKLSCRGPRN